jgi:chemotaxis response regulator CheB
MANMAASRISPGANGRPGGDVRQVRVLVVDDSLTIRAMIEQILSNDREIEVVGIAADADEAWDLLSSHRPDVMTLDIAMPGLDGLRFLSDVMARQPTPVVMVSSATAPGCLERDEAMRRGAVACFGKNHIISAAGTLARLVKNAARGRTRASRADALL